MNAEDILKAIAITCTVELILIAGIVSAVSRLAG
jgi:hypothetical protein